MDQRKHSNHRADDDNAARSIHSARVVFLGAVVVLLAIGVVALLTYG